MTRKTHVAAALVLMINAFAATQAHASWGWLAKGFHGPSEIRINLRNASAEPLQVEVRGVLTNVGAGETVALSGSAGNAITVATTNAHHSAGERLIMLSPSFANDTVVVNE